MKKLIPFLLVPTAAFCDPIILIYQDNSDNEDGFEMRGRLADGTWEVIANTAPNVTEIQVDTEAHEAWQVFAFNAWGYSGGTNVLEKAVPSSPSNLGPKKAPAYGKYERVPKRKDRG